MKYSSEMFLLKLFSIVFSAIRKNLNAGKIHTLSADLASGCGSEINLLLTVEYNLCNHIGGGTQIE
jgi:hypothetical protein